MAITLGSNIASLGAQRSLNQATDSLSQTFERLTSGLRINHASDDAAGLAIASSLNANARVAAVGVRNVNDGLSVTNILQGSLEALQSITKRQQELAEQAANGIYSSVQRQSLNNESTALTNEFNRIVQTTSFNGLNLLDGSTSQITIQAGAGNRNSLTINLPSLAGTVSTTTTTTSGDGTFQSASAVPGVFEPTDTIAVDVNGDGKLDLVETDGHDALVGVLLGNGDGTFGGPQNFSTDTLGGAVSYSVTATDLNGDGKLDLVVGNLSDNNAAILLGNGDGTFKAATSVQTGGGDRGMIAADVNGDGKIDLISANSSDGTASVFLGNGNGTFQSASSFATGSSPRWVTAADVNGDGKLDLLTADSNDNTVSVLLGNGNGTFQARTTLALAGGFPLTVIATDVNNDGKLDLISTNAGGVANILLGNGNGTFKAALSFVTGLSDQSVAASDLNGDGNADIIIADASDNTISILFGNGDGTFQARITKATGTNPDSIAIADINNDGALDLIVGNYGNNTSGIFLGQNPHATSYTSQKSFSAAYDLTSQSGAENSLATASAVEDVLSQAISTIGSNQSRLMVALSNLQTVGENDTAAASRIMDADVAQESAELTRKEILQQAAAAVLAQANQEPALALRLLSN